MSSTPPPNPRLEGHLPDDFSTLWDTLVFDEQTLASPIEETIRPPGMYASPGLDTTFTMPPALSGSQAVASEDLEILHTLGEGGMGLVRLARQRSLRREVAVKTVRPQARDAAKLQALAQEALVTGALEHPNVIPVYTYVETPDGAPLIVMKRVEGVSWREFLEGRRETPGEVSPLQWHIDVLLQVANALSFAHSRGIIHRDVKPENVMIGEFGEVYLLDWGLAASTRLEHRGLFPLVTEQSGVAGTPAYMAPEMASGVGALLGLHTDVYLLGATLHEVLTGTVRHAGATMREVLMNAYTSAPFSYSAAVPRELAEICNRATAREPRDRFRSVEGLRAALMRYLQHRNSIELSDEADARLSRLTRLIDETSAPENDRRIRDLFGECRFGFEQALKTWPENPEALRGVDEAMRTMAAYEILQRNVSAARALISALSNEDEHLVASLERLEAELVAQQHEVHWLREAAHQSDRTLGARGRGVAALVCGAGASGSLLLIDLADRAMLPPMTHGSYFIGWGITLMVCVAGIFAVFRRHLFANQVNRQIGIGTVTALASIFGFRGLVFISELPLDLAFRFELVLYGLSLGMLGVISNYRVLAAVPICLAGAFLDGLIPNDGLLTIAATVFLAFVLVAWAWATAAPSVDAQAVPASSESSES